MFSKVAIFVASTFALLAIAAPASGNISDSCNGGQVYCCNSVQEASTVSQQYMNIVASKFENFGPLTGQLGITCAAGSYKGAAGNSCSQQPTCCTGNNYNGLIVVGCTPININA